MLDLSGLMKTLFLTAKKIHKEGFNDVNLCELTDLGSQLCSIEDKLVLITRSITNINKI